MTDLNQLHKDINRQSNNIEKLTVEIVDLNKTLVKVVTDNDHRDNRIDDCKAQLVTVKKDIEEIHKQRTEDREEYKPVWDKSKQDQNNKAKYITNLTWFAIVALLIIITNSISSGLVKLPYSGKQETRQVK